MGLLSLVHEWKINLPTTFFGRAIRPLHHFHATQSLHPTEAWLTILPDPADKIADFTPVGRWKINLDRKLLMVRLLFVQTLPVQVEGKGLKESGKSDESSSSNSALAVVAEQKFNLI